ncbi:hypothetical protein PMG71_11405 [Roseofilum sp. BLCC_M154]|uniref:Porin family protein n=1 Tax=Roseofilum acuticapitatum BLCC-M154 TaxID=3022444 RepID=A0ABT7AT02_9CYAN|nr:hypothetical protein [Roseofilum acuticapitatum]MDJ1170034.1 hypothetical protein [Roseofilum acuticapitatum BLCC-M154]
MADVFFKPSLLKVLVLSLLSGILIKESFAFYQNSQNSASTPTPASIRPDSEEDYSPPPTPEIPPASLPEPPERQTPSDRWSIQLPSESELIANYEQWFAGAVPPSTADPSPIDSPVENHAIATTPSILAKLPDTPATGVKAVGNKAYLEALSAPFPISQATERAVSSGSLAPDSTPQNPEPFQPSTLPLSRPTQTPVAASPTATIMIPSAYGQQWGKVGVALGMQSRTRYTHHADAGLGIGIGLGNPQTGVGVDVGVSIVDLIGDTGQDGSVSVKIHRQLPQNWAIAVGVHNAIQWGNTDGGSSVYGVVSKRFDLRENISDPFSRVYVSAGVGGGQFRSEDNIMGQQDGIEVFGGVAVRVIPSVNAIVEWTGQDLTLGTSIVPYSKIPLVITPAVTDLTGSAGDGSRFILGIGYVFSF